ncbi:cytochrome P450 [Xylariales sp. AK1849]|nr:cytochrome P450 [Xylariales sp. AK1849]
MGRDLRTMNWLLPRDCTLIESHPTERKMDFSRILSSLDVKSVATVLVAAFLVQQICSAFSLAVLHPLAKFPGPTLAAGSDWWLIYHECFLGKSLTDILAELHLKYGPIVRYGPRHLHFSTAQGYSDIYNAKSKWNKHPEVYNAIVDGSSTFGLTDYHSAKVRRDIIWPFYSRQSVKTAQKSISRQVAILVDQLDKNNKEGRLSNMSLAFRCLAQDMVADVCLGKSLGTLQAKGFESQLILAIDEGLAYYVVMKSFPTLRKVLAFISKFVSLPGEAEFAAYGTLVADQVTKGIERPQDIPPHSMLGFMVLSSSTTAQETSQPRLSHDLLVEELQTFVIGGGETVASAMVQALGGTLQNTALYRAVFEEILRVWPEADAKIPSIEVLEGLPLLTAVIKESLRLTHGVVAPLPRLVSAEGAIIDSHHVPAGTIVGTSHVFIHLSEENFEAPEEFRPERWIEGNSSDRNLVAFSKGPRSCMGINLAWCQLYIALATLFRTVRMEYPANLNDVKIKWRDCFQPLYIGKPLQVRCMPNESRC